MTYQNFNFLREYSSYNSILAKKKKKKLIMLKKRLRKALKF